MENYLKESNNEKLMQLGLTDYESKAYNELIKVPHIGATKLARASNISRGRIYEVLENLISKGFCIMLPGATKNYKAIAPDIAIGNKLSEIRAKMLAKEKLLENTVSSLQQTYDSVNEEDSPINHVQILTTRTAINERIQQLQYECREVLRVFIKAPILMDSNKKGSEKRMKDQLKKQLKIKQIYEYDEIGYTSFVKSVFAAREKGADFDVRVTRKLPLKLVIFDDDHALFTLNREAHTIKNYSMMSVSHTFLTVAMIELFEFYWQVATPLIEFVKEVPIDE